MALPLFAQSGGWLERWRSDNDRGNRYEGRIEVPVSGSALELLSFVGQMEAFRSSVVLNVRFFMPTDEQISCGMSPDTSGVQVEARELREDKLYYMESKNEADNWNFGAWNEFGPWDTGAVLDREGVPSSNLGVVVKLDKKPWTAVAPAFVYHSSPSGGVEFYTVQIRPNANLSRVDYTLFGCRDGEMAEISRSTLAGNKIAGEPFTLRFDVREVGEGALMVRINGAVRNRRQSHSMDIRLYHRPGATAAG